MVVQPILEAQTLAELTMYTLGPPPTGRHTSNFASTRDTPQLTQTHAPQRQLVKSRLRADLACAALPDCTFISRNYSLHCPHDATDRPLAHGFVLADNVTTPLPLNVGRLIANHSNR